MGSCLSLDCPTRFLQFAATAGIIELEVIPMTTKQQALKAIKTMPEESTLEEIMERLHFIGQVNAGIRAADEGRTITHEEMKKRVRKWQSK